MLKNSLGLNAIDPFGVGTCGSVDFVDGYSLKLSNLLSDKRNKTAMTIGASMRDRGHERPVGFKEDAG